MKRYQAMYTSGNSGGGGSTPAPAPPGWDPTKNIFVKYRYLTRNDHLTLPYWPDFVEYCENVNSIWTLNDYLAKIDPITNTSQIGITKLKFEPLTDIVSPAMFSYNKDYNTSAQTSQWTSGNEGYKVYSFYHITHQQSDWSSWERVDKTALRARDIGRLIDSLKLYTDPNATVDVNVSNRNMMRYYGTKIKGSASGSDWVDLFKIGDTETLQNIQTNYASSYARISQISFYNYFGNQNDGVEPFDYYYKSGNLNIPYEPTLSQDANKYKFNAAPFAYKRIQLYRETINNITHTIYANVVIFLTINDTTEVDILT